MARWTRLSVPASPTNCGSREWRPKSAGFLDAALANPATPDQIATRVGSEQKLAAQVYAAASLVAEPGNAPARAYLGRLATALGLSADLVAHLEATTTAARAT